MDGTRNYYCIKTNQEGLKIKSIKKSILIMISVFFIQPVFAQNPEWITYYGANSIYSLKDDGNFIWAGTNGGLKKIDKTTGESTLYNEFNSDLPSNNIYTITIDSSGTKWIGTYGGGLASFDGTNWTVYDTSNSGLLSNNIQAIAIDANGNKWIGTGDWDLLDVGGLVVFNEGGIIVGIDDDNQNKGLATNFRLHQNYPNPFNPTTTIRYSLPKQSMVSLTVFDIRGQQIMTLQDDVKPPGNYKVQWNGMDRTGNPVSTGVYFCRLTAGDYTKTIKIMYLK